MSMILRLNEEERSIIVRALSTLADDYRVVSECPISPVLRRSFENGARNISSLAGRVAGLTETPTTSEMNAQVVLMMQEGRKIDAIKFVRTYTAMGLKDSKDYVEKIEREARL